MVPSQTSAGLTRVVGGSALTWCASYLKSRLVRRRRAYWRRSARTQCGWPSKIALLRGSLSMYRPTVLSGTPWWPLAHSVRQTTLWNCGSLTGFGGPPRSGRPSIFIFPRLGSRKPIARRRVPEQSVTKSSASKPRSTAFTSRRSRRLECYPESNTPLASQKPLRTS